MKARVKGTNNIIDVELSHYVGDIARYITKYQTQYSEEDLEFIDEPTDYWTRLEHQYAGMAMQGILSNQTYTKNRLETSTSAKDARDIIVDASWYLAHALVEKLKEKEERK